MDKAAWKITGTASKASKITKNTLVLTLLLAPAGEGGGSNKYLHAWVELVQLSVRIRYNVDGILFSFLFRVMSHECVVVPVLSALIQPTVVVIESGVLSRSLTRCTEHHTRVTGINWYKPGASSSVPVQFEHKGGATVGLRPGSVTALSDSVGFPLENAAQAAL